MKKFMDENFLLENETAKKLFFDYAKNMPICDYHNHLNAKEIYEDKKFENISQVWLGGDHYKWRLMRTNGYSEEYVTGEKSDYEKFLAFASTIPHTFANPMYHWTHLELQRYFGIYDVLDENSAEDIYKKCNEMLKKDEFSVRNLIRKMNVKILCTTDDPKDDLRYHKMLKEDEFDVEVLPTFRPDNLIHLEKATFTNYLSQIAEMGYKINSIRDVFAFLKDRLDYFAKVGCKISDHGLDSVMYLECTDDEADEILQKRLKNANLSREDLRKYKGCLMRFLGREYSKRDFVMQLHIGALRNNSTKMFNKIGADTGFDSINDDIVAVDLSKMLDELDKTGELPKTVLYCLNPSDNAVLATMIGNFQGDGIVGKMQFGAAWWFLDTKKGMINQMETLADLGLLSRFIGMLTDSRSFLSFPRHEYFRRILCNEIGKVVENGEYPLNEKFLGKMVENICFNNAKKYINL